MENPGNDINVTGVWKQGKETSQLRIIIKRNFTKKYPLGISFYIGITGKGVTVAILDDGLDYKSKDLKDNFVCTTDQKK